MGCSATHCSFLGHQMWSPVFVSAIYVCEAQGGTYCPTHLRILPLQPNSCARVIFKLCLHRARCYHQRSCLRCDAGGCIGESWCKNWSLVNPCITTHPASATQTLALQCTWCKHQTSQRTRCVQTLTELIWNPEEVKESPQRMDVVSASASLMCLDALSRCGYQDTRVWSGGPGSDHCFAGSCEKNPEALESNPPARRCSSFLRHANANANLCRKQN